MLPKNNLSQSKTICILCALFRHYQALAVTPKFDLGLLLNRLEVYKAAIGKQQLLNVSHTLVGRIEIAISTRFIIFLFSERTGRLGFGVVSWLDFLDGFNAAFNAKLSALL
ncbi:hypothetical protein [Candidatus Arsenophonus triatominarum]|uniref:hypothetical protein n=1 Tax=Candidatus Arsenophonus triatominarum TaxID=57911 RepID=UPI00165007E2|nr:hypothetical protein [Candidatus Arsenophonus triatominarum]